MRIPTLLLCCILIGILGINCQEIRKEEEDKDGGSGDRGIISDGVDNDDEDSENPTDYEESGEIDIDETTIPSTTTDIQSEEPTTMEEKPTTEEMPTTDEEVTISEGSGTEEPTDTDTESPTSDEDISGDKELPTITIKTKETTDSNEIPEDTTTSYPDLPTDSKGLPTTKGNKVDADDNTVANDNDNGVNAAANTANDPDESVGLNSLNGEVITAVVVGAVCAIIIIAFLVYRLKKRDEGSYALDESTHYTNKSAYKFSTEGKEAFV